MRLKLTLVIVAFLLGGCATVVSFDNEIYDKSSNFPAVSITVNNGEVGSVTNCGEFGCYSFPEKNKYYVYKSLKSSGKFNDVFVNKQDVEYKVLIQFTRFRSDETYVLLPKLLLGALTLFLIPIPSDAEFSAQFKLMNGEEELRVYEYFEEKQELQWILQAPNRNLEAASNYFVAKFISDLERDRIFENVVIE